MWYASCRHGFTSATNSPWLVGTRGVTSLRKKKKRERTTSATARRRLVYKRQVGESSLACVPFRLFIIFFLFFFILHHSLLFLLSSLFFSFYIYFYRRLAVTWRNSDLSLLAVGHLVYNRGKKKRRRRRNIWIFDIIRRVVFSFSFLSLVRFWWNIFLVLPIFLSCCRLF